MQAVDGPRSRTGGAAEEHLRHFDRRWLGNRMWRCRRWPCSSVPFTATHCLFPISCGCIPPVVAVTRSPTAVGFRRGTTSTTQASLRASTKSARVQRLTVQIKSADRALSPLAATTTTSRHWILDPFPPPFYESYLNRPHVQAALGVPLNWTQSSAVVAAAFRDGRLPSTWLARRPCIRPEQWHQSHANVG
jgi:hypothetical protein